MKEKKMLTALQIKTNGEVHVIEMEQELDDYYKYTECDIIDIVFATIGKKNYDIIVDDEGLLKSEPIFTAFAQGSQTMLAGTIVVVGSNGRGGFKSLTANDIANITECIKDTTDFGHPQIGTSLLEFEYANFHK